MCLARYVYQPNTCIPILANLLNGYCNYRKPMSENLYFFYQVCILYVLVWGFFFMLKCVSLCVCESVCAAHICIFVCMYACMHHPRMYVRLHALTSRIQHLKQKTRKNIFRRLFSQYIFLPAFSEKRYTVLPGTKKDSEKSVLMPSPNNSDVP